MGNRIRWQRFVGFAAILFGVAWAAPPTASAKKAVLRIEADMVNAGADVDAKGEAEFRERTDRTRFKVKVEHMDAGSYDLLVGGDFEARLDVGALGEGEVKFGTDSEPGEDRLPLTFDPRLQLIEVSGGDTVFLSVLFPDVPVVDERDSGKKKRKRNRNRNRRGSSGRIVIEAELTATPVLPDASGDMRYRDRKGRQDARIEIEDVPDGSYSVEVGTDWVGVLSVINGEGELRFDSRNRSGKLPLTFDPRGQEISVFDGAQLILHTAFPLQ